MKKQTMKHSMYTLFKTALAAFLIPAFLMVSISFGEEIVLFDGNLGTSPGSQGWVFVPDPLSFTDTAHQGYTNIDSTSDENIHVGYFSEVTKYNWTVKHPNVPVLDRSSGFILRFKVRINDEDHSSDGNRAGFNVIVTCQDLKSLELAFWENEIWTQTDFPLFTHSPFEYVFFDTTANFIQYELDVQDGGFKLYADGTKILTGDMHDYTSFDDPLDFPYKTPSFLFFGDDTTRGAADFDIAGISVYLKTVPGDINGDKSVDLADAVLGLKVCANAEANGILSHFKLSGADVGGNGVIGPEEPSYVLRYLAND